MASGEVNRRATPLTVDQRTGAFANEIKGNAGYWMTQNKLQLLEAKVKEVSKVIAKSTTSQIDDGNSSGIERAAKRSRTEVARNLPRWKIYEAAMPQAVTDKMVRAWEDLLSQDVKGSSAATKPAATRSSTRKPAATKPATTKTANTTVEAALDFLLTEREKGGDKFEETYHTQNVVNRLVSAALPAIQELAQNHTEKLYPFQSIRKDITIGYYQETMHKKKSMKLYPDSVLFLQGIDSKSTVFNREIAGVANLVSFEHKANLEITKKTEAVRELKRDFANKLNAVDILSPSIGYGVITDGIVWHFYRLEIISSSGGEDCCEIWVQESESVVLQRTKEETDSKNKKKKCYDFTKLAQCLAYTINMSLACSHQEPTNIEIDGDWLGPNPLNDDTTFKISKVLGTGRYFVLKACLAKQTPEEAGYTEENVTMKVAQYMKKPGRYGRMLRELDNLKAFADCSAIVSMVQGYELHDSYPWCLVLEDAGVPLDKLVVSGRAGKELAKVVRDDILRTALPAFKNANMVHTDLHPGNICIQEVPLGKLHAKVVDLESAIQVGRQLAECPIKYRDDLVPNDKNASFRMDEAIVVATLQCLWDMGTFHDLVQKTKRLSNMAEGRFQRALSTIQSKIK